MITVDFDRERETLRTVRYQERIPMGGSSRVGVLYLNKATVTELGNPETVRITIEDGDKR